MAEYAIGDLQGCYDPFMRLLTHIQFDDKNDRLWFVGDLVNRGPDSLAVLRFLKQLKNPPRITLGNHDLHFLILAENPHSHTHSEDTLDELLKADDCQELALWLRHQSVLIHDEKLNLIMCHAGIAPTWTLAEAKKHAHRFEQALRSEHYSEYLNHLYGNQPDHFDENLSDFEAIRVICNYFTRMRFCDEKGHLVLTHKGKISSAPRHLFPWFNVPHRRKIKEDIIFGHWAALEGQCPIPHLHAIDTGCVWGRTLTAIQLDTKERFAVSSS